jgi:hypothetical protein
MELKLVVSAVILFIVGFAFSLFFPYFTKGEVIAKIKKTERVYSQGSSKYLVFTDKEVFQNTDSLSYLKFNSSDIYGSLEIGKTYKFEVYGFRLHLFSSYRNIISVKAQAQE